MKKLKLKEAVIKMCDGGNVAVMLPATEFTILKLKELETRGGSFWIEEEEPQEEPKKPAPKKPAPKKIAATPKKSVDHGKICALYKAGWTPKKIADEMQLSDQTVYNHLDKEGLRNG